MVYASGICAPSLHAWLVIFITLLSPERSSLNELCQPQVCHVQASLKPLIHEWVVGVGTRIYFACRASILFAQSMKYFMLERSSWPPSCWRQASSPSRNPVFTGGILAMR